MTPNGRRLALGLSIAIVLGGGVAWVSIPSRWTISRGGMPCRVVQGLPRHEVLRQCGEPDRAGAQPKRGGGRGPKWINLCSAPCDRYGDRIVFYDCSGLVAEVETVSGYQGCVGVN